MKLSNRWTTGLAGLATAWALVACGGSSSVPVTPAPPVVAPEPGAPVSVGNVAIDGRNWINFRRSQLGVPMLTENVQIDRAAQAHSDYQRLNNIVAHDEIPGKPGFTGASLDQRLAAAGYILNTNASRARGEVISATTNGTGFHMAEELVTAIYHRFVMFEPQFKEIGTGAATASANYVYFTSDLAANNGYGPGVGPGVLATWPFNGQTNVVPNFFSDFEAPDAVPEKNEVGYPVSVHGDITAVLTVNSFTIRPRGGAILAVKLLQHASDPETPDSAMAIIPLDPLKAATTYDVSFAGTADGVVVNKTWSFTTQ